MNNIKIYRKQLFLHLDGLVLIPTLSALIKTKLLDKMIEKEKFNIQILLNDFKNLNPGYFNVSLRLLRSLGYVDFKENDNEFLNNYKITQKLNEILKFENLISSLDELTNAFSLYNIKDERLNERLNNAMKIFKQNKNMLSDELSFNFEGLILGPLLSELSFKDHIKILNERIFEICGLSQSMKNTCYNLFEKFNFIDKNSNITEKGIFFIKRSSAYGVTSSYINTLSKISELLTGDCSFIWNRDSENNEIHVKRSLNVWGSGGSHKVYFEKIDNIIIETFNRDIDSQPKGVIDIGCGDGTFLEHIYNIITTKTLRKDYLNSHPLHMVGTDINKAARISSRNKLNQSKINNIIINGNISEPMEINNLLKKDYNVNLADFLNTRSFLDHNRIFEKPKNKKQHGIYTTGTFCFKGKIVEKDTLINNLIEHLRKWEPFINKHGLILLELHTINPEVTKNNIGKTLSAAYDATHGYSDQYLVEHKTFMECCKIANLKINEKMLEVFPNSDYPTVSINYIR